MHLGSKLHRAVYFGLAFNVYSSTRALLGSLILGGFLMAHSFATQDRAPATSSTQAGKFANQKPSKPSSFWRTLKIFWRFMTEERVDPEPTKALPLRGLTRAQLDALRDDALHVIKLGHSSLLLKVMGEYWLIDPVFSERASPFSFMGPKRFHPAPITIDELPPIAIVLISHNHYDHLDKNAIRALAQKSREFLVPTGVDKGLMEWGVSAENIQTFDWWQSTVDTRATITFTPAQHFSGRGFGDANQTLWGSWVIETERGKLFFSGDSGYFPGFRTIGEKFGPFDLTFIETGAYNENWPDVHMTPEQSVAAHKDLRGKIMMPIHNGTFNLAFHAWYDPLERVSKSAQQEDVELTTPIVGEVITLGGPMPQEAWWKSVMEE